MLDTDYPVINHTTTVNFTDIQNSNSLTYYFVPFYTIVFFIGTFGNGLVIISILRSTRLRTVTNIYLLNIAIADFVLLLSIPLLIITILANGWIFGNILCKMYYNFIHINQYVSSLLLAALSFDRYLAVCHPVRAIEFRTKTKCVTIIAGCWLISILFLCPTWVFATATSERPVLWFGYRVQKCVIDFPSIEFRIPPEILFTYYAFLLGFLIPVSMITTFYVLLLIRLRSIRRKHRSETKQRSHRKVTRIVLAVVTVYLICWLPYWLVQIFITINPLIYSLRSNFSTLPNYISLPFLKELTHLTTIIGYANNCLNPVLYVFLSDSFREEYLILLKCFNPAEIYMEHALHTESMQTHNNKRSTSRQQTGQTVNHLKSTKKNLKHSLASDEIPSNNGSFPLFLNRSNIHKHPSSSSSSLRIHEYEKHHGEHRSPSHKYNLSKSSSDQQKPILMVKLSLTLANTPLRMIDDGGVYCGD